MGWRFRKLITLGFARFRVWRDAQGRWNVSVGVPFTGIYWVKRF